MREQLLMIGDGRTMACAEYGDLDSPTVMVANHGTGSSRLESAIHDDLFRAIGLRVVALERPGYGASTADATGRMLATWGDDVAVALEQLGIDRFAVSGYSGGGPHALAIAAAPALHDRVDRVILIASVAPGQPARHARDGEIRERIATSTWAEFDDWYESDIEAELASVAPRDEEVFADPEFLTAASATVTEGARQGATGEASDLWSAERPWGFELSAVTQPVDVWQGEADRVVDFSHAQALVNALPDAALHALPDEGHFSIGQRVPEIVKVLTT